MKNFKLQDIRKKATRLAYEQHVLDIALNNILENSCYHVNTDNLEEVCNYILLELFDKQNNHPSEKRLYPNIYDRMVHFLMGLTLDVHFETYTIWLWLQRKGLIVKNNMTDCSLSVMQNASERHWHYLARTILNNASKDVFYKMI